VELSREKVQSGYAFRKLVELIDKAKTGEYS
jgi:hypothetical protein